MLMIDDQENGGDGAELEVPLPQCFIDTIGQTNKFRIKVAHFNFTSNRFSLTVTKVVSPAVLPPKNRPLNMPAMPFSSSLRAAVEDLPIQTNIPDQQLTTRRNQSASGVMVRSSYTHVTPSTAGTDCPVSMLFQ